VHKKGREVVRNHGKRKRGRRVKANATPRTLVAQQRSLRHRRCCVNYEIDCWLDISFIDRPLNASTPYVCILVPGTRIFLVHLRTLFIWRVHTVRTSSVHLGCNEVGRDSWLYFSYTKMKRGKVSRSVEALCERTVPAAPSLARSSLKSCARPKRERKVKVKALEKDRLGVLHL